MLTKLAFVMQRLKKYLKKIFVMINKDGGGGQFLDFIGGHRAHGGSPSLPPLAKTLPGMANFGRSAVVSPAFKKQFYKELQTPFLMENNNKNNRTIEKQ